MRGYAGTWPQPDAFRRHGPGPVVIEHRRIDTAYVVSPPVGGVVQGYDTLLTQYDVSGVESIKSIYVVDTAGHTILLIPYPLTVLSKLAG